MDHEVAVQLMLGPEQLAAFGEEAVLERLALAEEILDFGLLILAARDPASRLVRRAAERTRERGARVALWTMVLADTGRPGLAPAVDRSGRSGRGLLGAWTPPASSDEDFSFRCPTAALADAEGPELAVRALRDAGADDLFLDRVRYPSPANGLEFLSACSCPVCVERYANEIGEELPDLAALAARGARAGSEGAADFLEAAAPALAFRARTIAGIVGRYSAAARAAGAGVGLDLFAPALSPLVGVDWAALSGLADFAKGMFYCKSRGPACLPLEVACHVEGLVAAGTGRAEATAFAATLLGLTEAEAAGASGPSMLPAARAAAEYLRAEALAAGRCRVLAGIELVDCPGYGASVSAADRDAYLAPLRAAAPGGAPIAVCWNLLYVPERHLRALAESRAVGRGR